MIAIQTLLYAVARNRRFLIQVFLTSFALSFEPSCDGDPTWFAQAFVTLQEPVITNRCLVNA